MVRKVVTANTVFPPVAPAGEVKRLGMGIQGGSNFAPMADLGMYTVRHQFSWKQTQPTQTGGYVWGSNDSFANAGVAAKVDMIILLTNAPTWVVGTAYTASMWAAQWDDDFWAYVSAVATRYKGKVYAYEILNECNINGWTGARAATVVVGAAQRIKSIDPNVKITSCALGGTVYDAQSFVNSFMSGATIQGLLDAVTHHTYQRPQMPEKQQTAQSRYLAVPVRVANSQNILKNLGYTKGTWMTEGGYNSLAGSVTNAVTEAEQARYDVRLALCNLQYQTICCIFHLFGANTGTEESGGMGIIRPDGTRKPSFGALTTLQTMLGKDTTSIGRLTGDTSNVWVFTFTRSRGLCYAVYSLDGTGSYTLTGLTPQVRKTTMAGVVSTVNSTNGALTVSMSMDPVYYEVT